MRNKPGSTIVVLYRAVYPSTGSATPLTYDDAGLQSQRTTAAIPSGADRIAGWPEAAVAASGSSSPKAVMLSTIGVSIVSRQTASAGGPGGTYGGRGVRRSLFRSSATAGS